MPVVLTDNIACELALSNDTQGIFRELVYDVVEINTSQVETNLDDLRPKIIPISLVKKEFIISIKQVFGRLLDVKHRGTAYNE